MFVILIISFANNFYYYMSVSHVLILGFIKISSFGLESHGHADAFLVFYVSPSCWVVASVVLIFSALYELFYHLGLLYLFSSSFLLDFSSLLFLLFSFFLPSLFFLLLLLGTFGSFLAFLSSPLSCLGFVWRLCCCFLVHVSPHSWWLHYSLHFVAETECLLHWVFLFHLT